MNSVQYSDPVPMDPIHRPFFSHGFQALPPIRSQHQHLYPSPTHSSGTSFPILAIAILGITATAFLLVSYYVFVIKCCLNWHRIDLLRRFSIPQSRRNEDPLMAYSPAIENRGLDELEIRAIPLLHFNRGEREGEERSFYECAVCLNEFQEDEKLRVLPNCSHAFHIDCIDIWLQSNANCPLCRSSISTTTRFPIEQIFAPSSSPQDPQPFTGSFIGSEEDFVVIELGEEGDQSLPRQEERNAQVSVQSVSPLPRKLEQRLGHKRARKLHKVGSLGDECIDIRERDDQFLIQPIRRSISMNSSDDRQLYLAVQEIIQQNRHFSELSTGEGCSSRIRRSFFSFGHGRGSRNAVLPI